MNTERRIGSAKVLALLGFGMGMVFGIEAWKQAALAQHISELATEMAPLERDITAELVVPMVIEAKRTEAQRILKGQREELIKVHELWRTSLAESESAARVQSFAWGAASIALLAIAGLLNRARHAL